MGEALPDGLRAAVADLVSGLEVKDLAADAGRLSSRYRAELRDGSLHLNRERDVLAYLATRLPATFGAIRAALTAVKERLPDFAPDSLLDIGAGPGTALFAASDVFNGLRKADALEASEPAIRILQHLRERCALPKGRAFRADVTSPWPQELSGGADLVTLAYVLDELEPMARLNVARKAFEATSGVLLIVEPGTPAGWRRILGIRADLHAQRGRIVAPCPHAAPCPLVAPDWCHFAARIARSRTHRRAKAAQAPFEDEKFAYLAVARESDAASPLFARVLAPPGTGSGKVELKLCRPEGKASYRVLSRREGDVYRDARRLSWGDTFSED